MGLRQVYLVGDKSGWFSGALRNSRPWVRLMNGYRDPRRLMVLLLVLTLGPLPHAAAAWGPAGSEAEHRQAASGSTDEREVLGIADGYVLRDGEYLAPPYELTVRDDQVWLAGQPLAAPEMPRRWRRHVNDPAAGPASNPWMMQADRGSADREHERPARVPVWAWKSHLERTLHDGGLIIEFASDKVAAFPDFHRRAVFAILCGDGEQDVQLAGLQQVGSRLVSRQDWARLIANFQLSEELSDRLLREEAETEAARQEAHTLRLQNSSSWTVYLLNLAGMVFAVLGLGAVLGRRPPMGEPWRNLRPDPTAIRVMGGQLVLAAAMSGFDLISTLVAHQSGSMHEVNPLARQLLDDPWLLAGFKAGAVAVCLGVVWAGRRYVGFQVAAWAICLILTLLTIRWVVFTSLFIGGG